MTLTPKEIKRLLFDNDLSIADLAREFSDALGRHVWPETLSRVIYGKPGYEQPDLRELLAKRLSELRRRKVKVEDLPRFTPEKVEQAEVAA
jgi:hypothetical protein